MTKNYLTRVGWGRKTFTNEEYKTMLVENLTSWFEGKITTEFLIALASNIKLQKDVEKDECLSWALDKIVFARSVNEKSNIEKDMYDNEKIMDVFTAVAAKLTDISK